MIALSDEYIRKNDVYAATLRESCGLPVDAGGELDVFRLMMMMIVMIMLIIIYLTSFLCCGVIKYDKYYFLLFNLFNYCCVKKVSD